MELDIRRAAVIGAGWTGTDIAALLASAGIETLLLDLAPVDPADASASGPAAVLRHGIERSGIARDALARARARGAFLDPEAWARIRTGNLGDDLSLLRQADWIIEVVSEDPEIKRSVYEQVSAHAREDAIVTSTTSALGAGRLTEGLPESFQRRFFVAHFFNPVRQTSLCEFCAGENTDRRIVERFRKFITATLGKGVIISPDTPGFLANRLGVFALMTAMHHAQRMGLSVLECDRITGLPMARPTTGTFRTADLIGLDTVVQILDHLHASLEDDPFRERFQTPDYLRTLLREDRRGDKTNGGFYCKDNDVRLYRDLHSGQYAPVGPRTQNPFERFENIPHPAQRLKELLAMQGREADFAWACLRDTMAYAAYLLGRLTPKPLVLDRVMRWGYNWELGPFEAWDALGVAETTQRMKRDGLPLADSLTRLIEAGHSSWYVTADSRRKQFNVADGQLTEAPKPKGILNLGEARVITQAGALRLFDIGDGVACASIVPPHGEGARLDAEFIGNLNAILDAFSAEGMAALIISGQSRDFSLGMNLKDLLAACEARDFAAVEAGLRARQVLNQRIKTLGVPVMGVLAGRVIGAGCELAMHCGRLHTHTEVQIGMTDIRAGLIPSGGGCKEMLFRAVEVTRIDGPFPIVRCAFDRIMNTSLARGVFTARNQGYFRKVDRFSMDRKRLLTDAKEQLVQLLQHGFAPPPRPPLSLPGAGGRAAIEHMLEQRRLRGELSEEVCVIGRKLAHVLCGGDCSPLDRITEDRLLELEREAFLSLCGLDQTPRLLRRTLNGEGAAS